MLYYRISSVGLRVVSRFRRPRSEDRRVQRGDGDAGLERGRGGEVEGRRQRAAQGPDAHYLRRLSRERRRVHRTGRGRGRRHRHRHRVSHRQHSVQGSKVSIAQKKKKKKVVLVHARPGAKLESALRRG